MANDPQKSFTELVEQTFLSRMRTETNLKALQIAASGLLNAKLGDDQETARRALQSLLDQQKKNAPDYDALALEAKKYARPKHNVEKLKKPTTNISKGGMGPVVFRVFLSLLKLIAPVLPLLIVYLFPYYVIAYLDFFKDFFFNVLF